MLWGNGLSPRWLASGESEQVIGDVSMVEITEQKTIRLGIRSAEAFAMGQAEESKSAPELRHLSGQELSGCVTTAVAAAMEAIEAVTAPQNPKEDHRRIIEAVSTNGWRIDWFWGALRRSRQHLIFSKTPLLPVLFLALTSADLLAQCTPTPIAAGQTVSGALDWLCSSAYRPGSRAKNFSFNATPNDSITVAMNSSAFDTFLILIGPNGTPVASDDDSGGGRNSLVVYRPTVAGRYMIEATSYDARETGPFTITLTVTAGAPSESCNTTAITNNQTLSAGLSASCPSMHRAGSFSKLYSFQASTNESISIAMNSAAFDTYLFLLGPNGSVIGQDDDGGGDQNSLIKYTASTAGTYTIEATSYSRGVVGPFTVFLSVARGGEPVSCATTSIATNQSLSGSLTPSCPSTRRRGSYAKLYTFSANANDAISVSMNSGAFDAYLYLIGPSGSLLAFDDDSGGNRNSLIRLTAPTSGSYTVEATSYAAGSTGAFGLSLGVSAGPVNVSKRTIFIIHGISQTGGPAVQADDGINGLAATLMSAEFGVDRARFNVDANFDYSGCGNNVSCDSTLCTIPNIARRLALYINRAESQGEIILIGYSLGGLVAREMILNNYSGVITNRRVAALITLGTPNAGYPYDPIDTSQKCGTLVQQMSSDFIAHENDTRGVIVSSYLNSLIVPWGFTSFLGMPRIWLAAAGRCCDSARRTGTFGTGNGCPTYNIFNDGVVCEQSASYYLSGGNLPSLRWRDPGRDYSHTGDLWTWTVLGAKAFTIALSNPTGNGLLVQEIRTLINGL